MEEERGRVSGSLGLTLPSSSERSEVRELMGVSVWFKVNTDPETSG